MCCCYFLRVNCLMFSIGLHYQQSFLQGFRDLVSLTCLGGSLGRNFISFAQNPLSCNEFCHAWPFEVWVETLSCCVIFFSQFCTGFLSNIVWPDIRARGFSRLYDYEVSNASLNISWLGSACSVRPFALPPSCLNLDLLHSKGVSVPFRAKLQCVLWSGMKLEPVVWIFLSLEINSSFGSEQCFVARAVQQQQLFTWGFMWCRGV